MGNPRKPTALRELHGTIKDHPNRQNQNQPEVTRGIGPPPATLSPLEAEIWDEVVGIIYKGVFAEGDRIALEMFCKLLFRFRYADPSGKGDIVPLMGVELNQLTRLLSLFGMTPSDRTKIVVPKAEKKNSFADL